MPQNVTNKIESPQRITAVLIDLLLIRSSFLKVETLGILSGFFVEIIAPTTNPITAQPVELSVITKRLKKEFSRRVGFTFNNRLGQLAI